MHAIEIRGLTKTYGKARGVQSIDLTVESGAFFGFIGPNGAGKSTTIRCLLGLLEPTAGEVRLFGQPVDRRSRAALLRRVGFMPGEAVFHSGLRVREILQLSADLRGVNCTAEADALCQRLQLDRNKKIEALSLGNRKKVSIVCALQHRPDLYILDEPTSGLDPLMQRAFFELLQERQAAGATVFLSSHILSEIQRHCTQAAIIREGRIIACAPVETLARTSARRVALHGISQAPDLPGIRDIRPLPDGVSFLYSGSLRPLTAALAALELTDLTITEPDLEEIFLHYYADPAPTKGDLAL